MGCICDVKETRMTGEPCVEKVRMDNLSIRRIKGGGNDSQTKHFKHESLIKNLSRWRSQKRFENVGCFLFLD